MWGLRALVIVCLWVAIPAGSSVAAEPFNSPQCRERGAAAEMLMKWRQGGTQIPMVLEAIRACTPEGSNERAFFVSTARRAWGWALESNQGDQVAVIREFKEIISAECRALHVLTN